MEHWATVDASDLEHAAAELYGLPAGEFVAARTAMEKAARAAGRRELAAAIKALAKPTAAAALTNRLARAHPGEVRALLDLGDELREATAARDGARLRELSARRNKLLDELLALARRVARSDGTKVTEDTARGVEESLRSASADPDLGRVLAAGTLADVLQQSGFPAVFAATDAPPVREKEPVRKEPAEGPRADRKAEAAARRLAEAEARVAAARADAEADATALGEAREQAAVRAEELEHAAARVDDLRAELDRAVADRDRTVGDERRARAQLATAERTARVTRRRLDEATAERDRLLEG